ncbi:hypothetical protein INT44_003054 [Umbelopsis vinacea]|uniref:Cytoplasmic protein n=1 Tax=Umbelopsis vinacea TaxID=44442 RepID=A0A8H7Q6K8_9FUNG|nr:hypothetical protein INT44_003054 [Umbelopsis vinacea]
MDSDNLTNHSRPTTDAILTVRCIKSFEYRTCKNLVLHVNLEVMTVGELKDMIRESKCCALSFRTITAILENPSLLTASGWKPYLNVKFDTLKLYTVAHGHKTQNLIINMDDDDKLIFKDDSATLSWLGFENETEISFFNFEAYEEYKKNPDIKW